MDWLEGRSTVEIYVQISHMETATEIGQSIKEGTYCTTSRKNG